MIRFLFLRPSTCIFKNCSRLHLHYQMSKWLMPADMSWWWQEQKDLWLKEKNCHCHPSPQERTPPRQAGRQAGMVLEQLLRATPIHKQEAGERLGMAGLWQPQSQQPTSNKAIPSPPCLTVLLTRDHTCKYLSVWGTFSSKPQCRFWG